MINDHKFYNTYVLPVLEEIKEEFKKRGVDTYINGTRIFREKGTKSELIVVYYYATAEFSVNESYHMFFKNGFNMMNYASELIFAPIKPKSIYDLEIGDAYFSISSDGNLLRRQIRTTECMARYYKTLANGYVFLTEEECNKAIAKNQAVAKIKERAHELQGDWKPNWKDHDGSKYLIRYNNYVGELVVNYHTYMQSDDVFFKTEEIAQQIIDELPEECKLMLGVE